MSNGRNIARIKLSIANQIQFMIDVEPMDFLVVCTN